MAKAPSHRKLECSVCLDLFKTPKILPCFHTFCQGCLQGLVSHSTHGLSLKCPQCRKDTSVPKGGVSNFQTNFYVTDDLEQHVVQKSAEKCALHQDQQVSHICKQCDVLICLKCKAARHIGHKASTVAMEIASAKKDLEELQPRLETRFSRLETALGRVSNDEETVEEKRQETKKAIEDKTTEWIAKLTKARDDALRSVDESYSERVASLNQVVLRSQKDQQTTKAILEQAKRAEQIYSVPSVLAARDKLKKDIDGQESIDRLISTLSKSSKSPPFKISFSGLEIFNKSIDSFINRGFLASNWVDLDSDSDSEWEPELE